MVTAQSMVVDQITKNENAALRTFLQRVLDELGAQVSQVILFGSKARGDSNADSDVDVLILASEENRRLQERINIIASQVSLDFDILINPLLIAEARWRQMSRERFSICRSVERDGVMLFSR
ncbi:MAG: nucleotidyltransferase domain-containing protein [Candidatus Villigracilaceae bacterium]